MVNYISQNIDSREWQKLKTLYCFIWMYNIKSKCMIDDFNFFCQNHVDSASYSRIGSYTPDCLVDSYHRFCNWRNIYKNFLPKTYWRLLWSKHSRVQLNIFAYNSTKYHKIPIKCPCPDKHPQLFSKKNSTHLEVQSNSTKIIKSIWNNV